MSPVTPGHQVRRSQPRWLSGLRRSHVHHCVLSNWDRILVRAVKGLISRAGMVSICPLLWQRDVKLQQTKPGPALHYPLQNYSAIRKTSAGQTKPVIQQDREQTNPKPTLPKWPRSWRPTWINYTAERSGPPPPTPLPAGKPTPNKHMPHGMTITYIHKEIKSTGKLPEWPNAYLCIGKHDMPDKAMQNTKKSRYKNRRHTSSRQHIYNDYDSSGIKLVI